MSRDPGTAGDRVLSGDAAAHALVALPMDPALVRAGAPVAASVELTPFAGASVGIWELTAGTVVDTEVDEVFVVVAGLGTLTFADASTVVLQPGVVVRLVAGDTTTWTVAETLRKVWLA